MPGAVHPFVAGSRLQGGLQEQGGFRVRVFPEHLPGFWQPASLCFPEPGLYLHLSSIALSWFFIHKWSKRIPCAEAPLPKAPPPHPNTFFSQKDGDIIFQVGYCTLKIHWRKRKFGVVLGFYPPLPAALGISLIKTKVLPKH